MNQKVGIYCRLSDEDRYKKDKTDDSESIANQKSMLLKYALNKNWEVINVYSDDDWSGADINRPQFKKLIDDCRNGIINIVLCKTQSRFSRDMEIVERYIHNKFIEWGVRFVSIVDNADTEVQGNKKARQINGLINEWYLEDLSENIRSSLQNKREDGLYLGAFAPYGYKKDINDKNKLIIDPVASEVIKEIFNLFKSGVGYYKIAQHLNDKGIITPTNYKKENGSKYVCRAAKYAVNTKWGQDTIAKILRNEVYIGNLVQGKRTYISYKNRKSYVKSKKDWTYSYGTHEPIIDLDTWNQVQAKFKSRARTSRTTGEIYMFSKKVYCIECKKVFTRQIYDTKDGKTPYMKCKGRRLANIECSNNQSIRCDVLEKLITASINEQLDKYYNLQELERLYVLQKNSINSSFLSKKDSLLKEKEELNTKLEKRNEHYKSLYEDKLEGIISQEDFIMFREKFSKEIGDYKTRLSILEQELSNIESSKESIIASQNIFEKYKHIDKLNREIIDEFIDTIWIGKINPETNERDIDVEMNIINLD